MTLVGFVLALVAAAPLPGQTTPSGSPYVRRPAPSWPERAVYQSPATPNAAGQAVLQADYQAELPGRDAAPAAAGRTSPTPDAAKPRAASRTGDAGSLPLPARGSSGGGYGGSSKSELPSALTVASSLAVVLGLFFVVAWALRRATPGEAAALPGEVVEVLGRKVISQRQQLQLLRCGKKLLLVSVTADAAETLTEITDPEEVDRLAGLCRQTQPGSATATFRQVMQQFSNDRTGGRHV